MKPDLERLPGIIARIDAAISTLPRLNASSNASFEEHRTAVSALCSELTDYVEIGGEAASILEDGTGTRVVIAGIRAHSTTGAIGALRNWQAGARRAVAAREARR